MAGSLSPCFTRQLRVGCQHVRRVQTLNFGGTLETVHERKDWTPQKIKAIFQHDSFSILGYGTLGRAQALNIRDNGFAPIVGLRPEGPSWQLAIEDGFVPGETLFPVREAAERSSVIMNMLSDAGQKAAWRDEVEPALTKGKTLFFAHGFSIVFADQTGIVPPKDIDVIMVAPKGSGTTVRRQFLQGRGINASVAVHQDVSGEAWQRARALGVAVGTGYMFDSTFDKEVVSDLTGERGSLMGAIQGLFQAQYSVLREKGHTPCEAFNETVEEATQSLYPLIGENGMDWMFANCSSTAQRGALDWAPRFQAAIQPVMRELYEEVENGNETARTLDCNSRDDYRESLAQELDAIANSEMWQAGRTVRGLRSEKSSN